MVLDVHWTVKMTLKLGIFAITGILRLVSI